MFDRISTFAINKPFEQLVSEMEEARRNSQPVDAGLEININETGADFVLTQDFKGPIAGRHTASSAKGSLRPAEDQSTRVRMEISPLTDSVAILILVYLVGVILFYVIASEISDSKLGGYVFLIISVGNLFWTGGSVYTQFAARMDTFFGTKWR